MSWHVLPRKRSPAVDDRPPCPGGRVRHSNSTSVFIMLRQLLGRWRDDPDKLATACAAYTLAGYSEPGLVDDVASGWNTGPFITEDEAREKVMAALRGRHSRVLRLRAEGVLLALEEFAQDAEEAQLHRTQVDAAVIECRELNLDERITKLRLEDGVS